MGHSRVQSYEGIDPLVVQLEALFWALLNLIENFARLLDCERIFKTFKKIGLNDLKNAGFGFFFW